MGGVVALWFNRNQVDLGARYQLNTSINSCVLPCWHLQLSLTTHTNQVTKNYPKWHITSKLGIAFHTHKTNDKWLIWMVHHTTTCPPSHEKLLNYCHILKSMMNKNTKWERFSILGFQTNNCNISSIGEAMTLVNEHGNQFDIFQMPLTRYKNSTKGIQTIPRLCFVQLIDRKGNDGTNDMANTIIIWWNSSIVIHISSITCN